MLKEIVFLCFACLKISTPASVLPSFIKKCSLSDPKLSECVLNQSDAVIKELIKGVPSFSVPKLNPLHIEKLDIDLTNDLVVKVKDVNVYGIDSTHFLDIKHNAAEKSVYVKANVEHIELTGFYDINGKILLLEINGNGELDIKLTNLTIEGMGYYTVEERNGDRYLKIKSVSVEYEVGNIVFKLTNLFGGNKELGDRMNEFINENWRKLSTDLRPSLVKTISDIVITLLSNILRQIPEKNLFDD